MCRYVMHIISQSQIWQKWKRIYFDNKKECLVSLSASQSLPHLLVDIQNNKNYYHATSNPGCCFCVSPFCFWWLYFVKLIDLTLSEHMGRNWFLKFKEKHRHPKIICQCTSTMQQKRAGKVELFYYDKLTLYMLCRDYNT